MIIGRKEEIKLPHFQFLQSTFQSYGFLFEGWEQSHSFLQET